MMLLVRPSECCRIATSWWHSSSRMRVINHNWSATKQRPHPQSVAEISRNSVLSWDRIRQCETSSGSRHKDIDQCLMTLIAGNIKQRHLLIAGDERWSAMRQWILFTTESLDVMLTEFNLYTLVNLNPKLLTKDCAWGIVLLKLAKRRAACLQQQSLLCSIVID